MNEEEFFLEFNKNWLTIDPTSIGYINKHSASLLALSFDLDPNIFDQDFKSYYDQIKIWKTLPNEISCNHPSKNSMSESEPEEDNLGYLLCFAIIYDTIKIAKKDQEIYNLLQLISVDMNDLINSERLKEVLCDELTGLNDEEFDLLCSRLTLTSGNMYDILEISKNISTIIK